MQLASAPGRGGASGGRRGSSSCAARAASGSSSSSQIAARPRSPLLGRPGIMQLQPGHPLALVGRRRLPYLAAPPPVPAASGGGGGTAAGPPDDDNGGSSNSSTNLRDAVQAAAAYERRRREAEAEALAELGARDLTRRSRREAEAARQALAALLGGAGSRAFRTAADAAAAPSSSAPPAGPTTQQQQQQQAPPRFAYSREGGEGGQAAASATSAAAAAGKDSPTVLPYGTTRAAERLVALNAPAYYMSAQATMPAEERAAAREAARAASDARRAARLAAKRRAAADAEEAARRAAGAAGGESDDEDALRRRRRKRQLKVDPVAFMSQVRVLQAHRLADAAAAMARQDSATTSAPLLPPLASAPAPPAPGKDGADGTSSSSSSTSSNKISSDDPEQSMNLTPEQAAFWEASEAVIEYQRRLDEADDDDDDEQGDEDELEEEWAAAGFEEDAMQEEGEGGARSTDRPRMRLLLDPTAESVLLGSGGGGGGGGGLGGRNARAADVAAAAAAGGDPADENLEAAARLPTAAPQAALAEARALERRDRLLKREIERVTEEEERAMAAAGLDGGSISADPERLRVALAELTRRARRSAQVESEAQRRIEESTERSANGGFSNRITAEGPYDPIRDLWERDTWHPRRELWSPVPTEAPRQGPVATSRDVRNPYAPRYFRFQSVVSTLSQGLEAVLGPETEAQQRDASLRPRPPGAPWKALPRAMAAETAPSPIERLASAAAALFFKGDGGRAIVHAEAMRADESMAEKGPWLPSRVVLRHPEAVAEVLEGGGQAGVGVAAAAAAAAGGGATETTVTAAAEAAPALAAAAAAAAGPGAAAAAAAAPPAAAPPPTQPLPKSVRASTPGRLLTALATLGTSSLVRPDFARLLRARIMVESGGLSTQDTKPFAYSAGYEYVQYSTVDRAAQLALATLYLAAAAAALSWVHFSLSQGLALALGISLGLGTLNVPKVALLFGLAAAGKAWLYPAWLAFVAADKLVGWMGERLQGFFRAQALVWLAYLLLAPAHWHPLPFPWIQVTGS
jgi:hypothetical protein